MYITINEKICKQNVEKRLSGDIDSFSRWKDEYIFI